MGGPASTGLCDALISCAQRLQRRDVDLRERRERLDRVGEDVDRDVGADGERRLLQPLAGLGTERVRARQPLAVAEERQEAVALGVGMRVGGGLGDLRQRDHRAEAAGVGADRGGLRIGVDHARHGLVVRLARLPEDVRRDHVALVLADVGQRPQPGDVPDRPEPLARAQVRVDRDSVGVGLDPDGLQAHPADPRAAARRDEQPVAAQLATVVELEDVVVAVASRAPSCWPTARARCRRGAAPRRAPRPAAPARVRADARTCRRSRPRRRGAAPPGPSPRRPVRPPG